MSSVYYLSLGAGMHQQPLIESAQKMGLKVIGVDRDPQALGLEICDIKIHESVINYRKIFYKVNSLLLDGEIIGGYAASYGKALLSWSYLAEKLRVIGVPRPLMERLLDKYEVRKMLVGVSKKIPDFRQPAFMAGTEALIGKKLTGFKGPCILKPRAGWGKRGIWEAQDIQSLQSGLAKNISEDSGINPASMIVEEKIPGDEITVTGFVQSFRFNLICLSDKITSESAPFIELEHRYPSKYHALAEKITVVHQEIVETLQLTDTPIVSEWKIFDEKLYLIEISAQIPGEFLASFLIPRALNYSFYENLVKLTLGRVIERKPIESKTKPGIVKFFPEILSEADQTDIKRNSDLFALLNENPKIPPEGNRDRFAVAGYIG